MERKQVDSSNIAAVGYDKDKNILEIEFKQGGIYQYISVPKEAYNNLMGAVSLGKFFHANIKGKFSFKKVGE